MHMLLLALSSSAAGQVNVSAPTQGLVELPVVVAMRNGYFRAEGLVIQKIQIEPEIAVKALLSGEIEFVLGWEASLRAALSGAPIKVVAATVSRPLQVLISRSEIRSGRDLKGKSLGIDYFASTIDYLSRLALRYSGIEPDKEASIVELGNGSRRIEALKAGSIHATAVDVTMAAKAEEEGYRRLLHIGDIIDLPVFGIAVTTEKLAAHRDRVKKFIRAALRGARFVKQHRTDSLRIIQSYLKIPPTHAARAYDSSVQFFTDDGFISDRALSLSVRRAEDKQRIAYQASLSQVADWSLLREILSEKRKAPFWLKQYDP